MKYTVEERNEGRCFLYRFEEKNAKGESLLVSFTKCENPGGKNSLPYLWEKNGYIDRVLETYWGVDTEIEDTEGNSWRAYDPSIKRSEDGKRNVINFEWMLEATEENKEKLLNEIYRLFITATGKTATEKKHDKVREYGKENNIEVVETMPEGWIERSNYTDPRGGVSIYNVMPIIKTIKDGTCQRKLLLV